MFWFFWEPADEICLQTAKKDLLVFLVNSNARWFEVLFLFVFSESLEAGCDSHHVNCQSEMEQTESDGNESSSNCQNEGSEVSVDNGKNEIDSAFADDDKATKEEAELRVEGAESRDEVVPCVSCDKVFVDGNGNLCERNELPAKISDGGMEDGRAFDGRGSEDLKECCSSAETSDLQGLVVSGKRRSERGTAAPRSWIWNHVLMIPVFLFPLKVVARILSSRLHLWREKVVA